MDSTFVEVRTSRGKVFVSRALLPSSAEELERIYPQNSESIPLMQSLQSRSRVATPCTQETADANLSTVYPTQPPVVGAPRWDHTDGGVSAASGPREGDGVVSTTPNRGAVNRSSVHESVLPADSFNGQIIMCSATGVDDMQAQLLVQRNSAEADHDPCLMPQPRAKTVAAACEVVGKDAVIPAIVAVGELGGKLRFQNSEQLGTVGRGLGDRGETCDAGEWTSGATLAVRRDKSRLKRTGEGSSIPGCAEVI
ncbi:hypothetical protein PCL_00823 [Purpureocillium lilacinum]|uniref:Uncharacterized protein n=1 Tax=Purpureocillium lilacinum TaxID=33203 RepID=A0A2U3DP17_PURLI|nr:hypothetical protein PCL_00823 [Purpureocillium lilacinum]